MEEKIRDILEQQLFLGGFEPEEIEIGGITEAAAEIAREFEQAQRQLDARRELNDELRAENTQLLAQVAKMGEALKKCSHEEYYISRGTPEFLAKRLRHINTIVEEALSAAPSVL
jgi:phage/plasmid primase-like uncharacterized protein